MSRADQGLYQKWQEAIALGEARLFGVDEVESTTKAAFIWMTIAKNGNAKELRGIVVDGQFEGRNLDDMSSPELISLYEEAKVDDSSKVLLEAFFAKINMDGWGNSEERDSSDFRSSPEMNFERACRVLGIEILDKGKVIEREVIVSAFRSAAKTLHPDAHLDKTDKKAEKQRKQMLADAVEARSVLFKKYNYH